MGAYYNEHDAKAAAWLRELIKQGHIAPGDVDERSIEDVSPDDLRGYVQCHFFAGIGGWSLALRYAGWEDERPVWTGSCPCQPFSAAGKGAGFADERHLWPAWLYLIAERRPNVIFGEQAETAIRHGWLDLIQSDLEGVGYACGAVPFPACGVGAPHIRQRLYFVADADDAERRSKEPRRNQRNRTETRRQQSHRDTWQRLHGENWRAVAASFCGDANGFSARMDLLRGYGNAINVEQAQAFIEAYLEC